jgi:type I restriction enzyme, S subunit
VAKLGDYIREECHPLGSLGAQYLRLIGVSNEHGLHASYRETSADLARYQRIEKNWFAFNPMRVNVGSIGLADTELKIGFTSPDYTVFSCRKDLNPHYLLHFLKSDYGLEAIARNCSGAVRKRLYYSGLAAIELPVPSLDEQCAFVARIDRISETIRFIREENSDRHEIPPIKQAILQEAIQGKLTADWRAAHPDVEPASQLLHRIQAEKARLVAAKKLRKEKPLPKITPAEIPFEVPKGWEWCRLVELAEKTGSGSTPSGGHAAYSTIGIPFLRSQNVHDDGLLLDNVARISTEIHQRMQGTTVFPEDLLLNITGGSIGRCAIISDEIDEANVNQHVAIIRPVLRPLGKFLHAVILSPYFQDMIEKAQTGAGREGLPKNKMDRIPIPLPPLAEQAAIVERVDGLMTTCRALETEIEQSRTHAAHLLQAILKEAFAPAT